jgi:hypothetical protein
VIASVAAGVGVMLIFGFLLLWRCWYVVSPKAATDKIASSSDINVDGHQKSEEYFVDNPIYHIQVSFFC